MDIDLDLYRREVRVSATPLVRLSVLDISPDHQRHTLFFIHGFGGHAMQWRYQLNEFAQKNRVIALDLRGHGLSDKPAEGYDIDSLQIDLDVALDVLKVKGRFVLIGHSFGGALAVDYSLRHPERIDRLVLIATPGEFRLSRLYRIGLHLPDAVLGLITPFTRKWLAAPPTVLKPFYHKSLSLWKGWNTFNALQVPTLVIRGHRDAVFEKPAFARVASSIRGAEDVDIKTSGHMVMLERRQAVNRAIARFLESKSQRSWRDSSDARKKTIRSDLTRQRIWLNHYEEGVPFTIGIPRIPLHHLLRSAVRRFPRHPAIIFEGKRYSYRWLNHEANRFANSLIAGGFTSGARIMIHLPNIPQAVIALFGTMKAGCVAVLSPTILDSAELARQIKEVEASALVTLNLWSQQVIQVQARNAIPLLVLTDAGEYLSIPKRWISRWRNRKMGMLGAVWFRPWISSQGHQSPSIEVKPDDLAIIQFTGGTTAQARGVMLSHKNLVANALQTRHWLPKAEEGRERFLSVLPLSHSYGLTTALIVPIALGATMILKPKFQLNDILRTIRKYRPTIFPGVPNMYVAINNYPGVRRYGIKYIKACISGSAPLPVEVQEAFEKLTRGRLVEGYGLTEASPVTHANPLAGNRRPGMIGVPIPSTEAAIVDLKHGRKEVKTGQIGELAVRGPQVMMGYWKDDQATREVLMDDGWLLTGDVAQMDETGYFRIIARKADMWYPARPGKIPAFPRDVEEVIYEIPQVKEVAVTAIAGNPFAFIIADGERPSPESVITYCKRRLPPYLVPRFVIFMEEFPRTFIGKVLRRELAERYERHLG